MQFSPSQSVARRRMTALGAAFALGVLAGPSGAHAQSAIIYGSVGNFDISNDTGKICHGFEVDLDGQTTVLPPSASFSANRYGAPNSFPYTGGVAVRWESPYDAEHAVLRRAHLAAHGAVVPGAVLPVESGDLPGFGLRALRYRPVGTGNITNMTARWLCEDPANPGTLAPVDPPTAVPYPSYYVQPPVQPNLPPQVVIVVPPPRPRRRRNRPAVRRRRSGCASSSPSCRAR